MKKDPIKLLKLLDIFTVMENLRLNFNRLFGGKACDEIQTLTRDLINRVVIGACEIFWELPSQVELQRRFSPPSDGGVPGLIYSTMKEVGLNFDAWSKAYEDISLSYFFMMNNHCHFSQMKGTQLGDIMGDSWLEALEKYKGLISFPFDHQDFDNKLFKAFNEAFDERYKKHSNWVISDESLRQKVCQLLVQAVVPVYKSYMHKYGVLVEQDASAGKCVKHTA
ncbi:exocyst complex component EXO70A1 [Prunus yedoensis var. nudiflora]|uniref:Exocyst subunit Exo70 family protein n=1 Tax=Prunus yedoensis var. nudiflora TaxID=2094558 RepID=A0A314Z6V1_PRUYE|nr:exocyst complex component EXO70A1 [Prunus yedoensis var. nudiflora]